MESWGGLRSSLSACACACRPWWHCALPCIWPCLCDRSKCVRRGRGNTGKCTTQKGFHDSFLVTLTGQSSYNWTTLLLQWQSGPVKPQSPVIITVLITPARSHISPMFWWVCHSRVATTEKKSQGHGLKIRIWTLFRARMYLFQPHCINVFAEIFVFSVFQSVLHRLWLSCFVVKSYLYRHEEILYFLEQKIKLI